MSNKTNPDGTIGKLKLREIDTEPRRNDDIGEIGTLPEMKPHKVKKIGKIRSFFVKIWTWFNEKKTAIGFVLTTTGTGLTKTKSPEAQVAGGILLAIGLFFGTTGVVHKLVKSDNKITGKKGELKLNLIELFQETWRLLKLWVAYFKKDKKKG